ncbi:Formyl-coenzyme A transferase [Frankia canadensis]|uniref:Formyl-coenzyme A transferase n=1 Tax=Frankia canadensis TaxID=1836972 RepID=A0A2I2KXW0_9ACTN|nr:CaiB/BaiF CoA-transferase family protein [Frankia canadensis]SNQ50496.1 Formyl-coenzyme A transferase [Frankia canadensis]SOU57786.1 Formyl-coenzyme A transferase [Frankia canadensis]
MGETPLLAGITVVAVEQAVAAPLASRHLADLGARVIKVERPDGGDFARRYDTAVAGMGSHFVWLNRGKESITLDLKHPAGAAVLADLVARADVLLQNLAPGVAARLGFGSDEVRARHPRLVTVSVSGYGTGGPFADRRAYDMLVQSETGLASVTGPPERAAKTGIPASDIAAGMYAFSGALAALLARERTGHGAAIETSLFDATAEWLGYQIHYAAATGVVPPRAGLSHASIAPYDAFPTADGAEVLIGIQNDREWARFATSFLGRPDLVDHPDWATNVARVRHRRLVDALIGGRTATLTADETIARLDAIDIASARLNSVADLLTHPQLVARERWRDVDTPVGPVRALRPPIDVVAGGVAPSTGPVPALGEHTDAVLRWLGYPTERIARLRAAGAV